jgi:uncharacterized membrane protein
MKPLLQLIEGILWVLSVPFQLVRMLCVLVLALIHWLANGVKRERLRRMERERRSEVARAAYAQRLLEHTEPRRGL